MPADPEISEGARVERNSLIKYLRGKITKLWDNQSECKTLEEVLEWLLKRQKKYDKQTEGLGKKK